MGLSYSCKLFEQFSTAISFNIPAMFSVLWNVELNPHIPLNYADSYADMYVKIEDAARIFLKQLAMNIVRFSRVAGRIGLLGNYSRMNCL